ncbi:flagellar C1a complex subunit C1a-32-domain-containing protein [Powellomyces hirtus]|nr:flagellar C1a complex subunit C1a-32-domain-containing protein [Powellomyces hirtus]
MSTSATGAAGQPATPQRTTRGTPPTSAGNRSSTSGRPRSSREKSAGKREAAKRSAVEDAGRDSPWDDPLRAGPPLTWSFISQDDLTELVALESMEAIVRKFAQMLGVADTHRKDLNAGILVMFNVGNYLFAKDNEFTASETAALCAIMKSMFDKDANSFPTLEKIVSQFRDTLLAHAAPANTAGDGGLSGWEVFRPENIIKITDFVVVTFFQHYRLYQNVLTVPQEAETLTQTLHLEEPPVIAMPTRASRHLGSPHSNSSPNVSVSSRKSSARLLRQTQQAFWPPPLSQHLPLAVYEAQKQEEAQREAERIAAEEALREAERKAAENPFEVLDNETVKVIATEAVAGLLGAVQRDVEARLEDLRVRFLEKLAAVK